MFLDFPILGKLKSVAGPEGAGFEIYNPTNPSLFLPLYLGLIVRAALTLLGVIFFALTIYGGFLWLYAGGNEEQVKKAKAIITRAIIGLIITLFAGGITQFVIYYFGR